MKAKYLFTLSAAVTLFLAATVFIYAQDLPVVTIANTDEYSDLIDPEFEDLLTAKVESAWPFAMNNTRSFVIMSIRHEDSWGIITLSPEPIESGWELEELHYSPFQVQNTANIIYSLPERSLALQGEDSAADIIRANIPEQEQESYLDLFSLPDFTTQSNQKYANYKFPFEHDVSFNIWRHPVGWHNKASGYKALDFGGIGENDEIVAMAPGKITSVCINQNGQQAYMKIQTQDPDNPDKVLAGESLLYLHFDKSTIPANIKKGNWVRQGQVLGKAVAGGNEINSPCPQYGVGRHSHITFPHKPMQIDGYTFTTYSNGNLKILNDSGDDINWQADTVFHSSIGELTNCDIVEAALWEVYEPCILTGNHRVNSHVWIRSGAKLVLEAYSKLDIDFENFELRIAPSGSVILKEGAKIH